MMLLSIVWSFVVLFIGTVLITLEHYLDLGFLLRGRVYLWFSLVLDIAGGLLTLGIIAALIRRYALPGERRLSGFDDAVFLLLLLGVVLLGFTVEGLRLALLEPRGYDWSFMGAVFAVMLKASLPQGSLEGAHRVAWLAHGVLAMAFVAYIPYSKAFHLFAAQITTRLSAPRYGGIVYD
jgi:nitrate reductase gamma subunit